MSITIEWTDEEGAYIVRHDGEFIGDFEELLPAAEFALAVAANADAPGPMVELLAVNLN